MPTMLSLLLCGVIAFVPSWTTAMMSPAIKEYSNASAMNYSPPHLITPDVPQHYARPRCSLSTATCLDAADMLSYDAVHAARTEDAAADVRPRMAFTTCKCCPQWFATARSAALGPCRDFRISWSDMLSD